MTRRDALRLIGLSRDAAREAKRAAIQAQAFAEGAHTALQDIHTRPPQKPSEPTEPEPEPKPRLDPPVRPKPPTGGETVRVQVNSSLGSLDQEFGQGNTPAMAGDLPVLVSVHGPRVIVAPCNPFRGGGDLEGSLDLAVAGDMYDDPGLSLTGGRMAPHFFQLANDAYTFSVTPGPHAQQAARKPLLKGRVACGFGIHNGVEVACWNGVKDKPGGANQPGGWGVYPFIGYWEDWREGRALSHRMMRGWAARMSIFRFREDAWREGRLELESEYQESGYYGGCGTDQLPGYTRPGPNDADDLDHEHFGRAGNVVRPWAERGDPFARLVEDAMFVDVLHRWGKGNFNADQLNRAFAHSLFTAVGWSKRDNGHWLIGRMVGLARQHQRDDGHVYFIPQGAGKWTKKVGAKKDILGFKNQPGETTDEAKARCVAHYTEIGAGGLVIAFEAQLVCAALKEAEELLGLPEAESVWKPLADALGPYPPEVIFPDSGLGADKAQAWGHMLPPWKKLGSVNLPAQASNYPIGDGAAASAPPSLWPSAGEVGG